MWNQFLQRVWGSSEGWACIAYMGVGQEFKQKFYQYPGQLGMLLSDVTRYNNWANVYFCPHLFTSADRKKTNAMPVTALWVDKDKGSPEEIYPKPTICWQTSEGKYQALWILTETANPDKAEQVNRYLTYSSKADKGGWHLGKVIRFPSSVNYKYTPPHKGFTLWDDGPKYTLEELLPQKKDDAIKELVNEQLEEKAVGTVPSALPSAEEVLTKYGKLIPQGVWDLLNTTPQPNDDWSHTIWKLEKLLLESSIPPEAVFILVRDSPWNKYKRDGRADDQLWIEIHKAVKDTAPAQSLSGKLQWYGLDSLMNYSKRPEWLVENIWMDENVGWLAGVGKSYKSVLSLDLALSIASGTPFLGKYEVMKQGPVLMVQEEDPVWRVARRVQVMARAKGITGLALSYDDFTFSIEVPPVAKVPLYISIGGGFGFSEKDKVKDLELAIQEHKPRMVFLDPWFMLSTGVDEFKSGEVTTILNILKQWRNKYGCSICILHHFRKEGNGEPHTRLYGSHALYSWSENSLFVDRNKEGNRVLIERDIKDALEFEKIAVEFEDIDEEYIYSVVDEKEVPKKSSARDRVEQFLLTNKLDDPVTRSILAKACETSAKTITKVLKDLEKEDKIITEVRGQGGKIHIDILPLLYEKRIKKEGMVFEFTAFSDED